MAAGGETEKKKEEEMGEENCSVLLLLLLRLYPDLGHKTATTYTQKKFFFHNFSFLSSSPIFSKFLVLVKIRCLSRFCRSSSLSRFWGVSVPDLRDGLFRNLWDAHGLPKKVFFRNEEGNKKLIQDLPAFPYRIS